MDRWRQFALVFFSCVILTSYYLHQKTIPLFLVPLIYKPNLTWKDMLPYFSWKNVSACQTYYEFGGVLNRLPLLTFLDGQKSVCLDPGVSPVPGRCVVYSFGNNGEWSFDEQIESYGCDVYVFDPSVR